MNVWICVLYVKTVVEREYSYQTIVIINIHVYVLIYSDEGMRGHNKPLPIKL